MRDFSYLFLVASLFGCYDTETSTTDNLAPEILSVTIEPTPAFNDSSLRCVVEAEDPESDPVNISYRWLQAPDSLLAETEVLDLEPLAMQPETLLECQVVIADAFQSVDGSVSIQLSNRPPTVDALNIDNLSPTVDSTLTCSGSASDPDQEVPTLSTRWSLNGAEFATTAAITLTPETVEAGDTLACEAQAKDGYGGLGEARVEVVVDNSVPSIGSLEILPASPTSQSTLVCTPGAVVDLDLDEVQIAYAWTLDGVSQPETGASLSGPFPVGSEVACIATPSDPLGSGSPMTASTLIANTAPALSDLSITPNSPQADSLISCSATGSDLDGETLQWSFQWSDPAGNLLGASDTLQLSPTIVGVGDMLTCTVTVADPHNATEQDTVSVVVANSPPTVTTAATITATPEPITTGNLSCSATLADLNDGNLSPNYEWTNQMGDTLGSGSSLLIRASETEPGDVLTCAATATDVSGEGVDTSASVTVLNSAPTIGSLSLTPSAPFSQDTVTCEAEFINDLDEQAVDVGYSWSLDGQLLPETTSTLDGPFEVGATIQCTATPNDGSMDGIALSASLTIANTHPTLGALSLSPGAIYTDDLLTVSGQATDPDGGQSLSLTYEWHVIEALSGTDTVVQSGASPELDGSAHFERDDQVYVVATPFDGVEEGLPLTSATTTVLNSPPEALSLSLSPSGTISNDATIVCTGSASDPDAADTLSYSTSWSSGDSGETLALDGSLAPGSLLTCTVSVSDGSDSISDTLDVILGNRAPTIDSIALDPLSATAETPSISCLVLASDPDGEQLDLSYEWSVDGQVMAETSSSLSGPFLYEQLINCTATPSDLAGSGQTDSASLTIANTHPTLGALSLSPGAIYTDDLLTVSGQATDPDGGQSLSLTYEWHVIEALSGTDTVVQSGASPELDGSLYFERDDDIYVIGWASDGLVDGPEIFSGTITVLNTSPTQPLIEVSATQQQQGTEAICTVVQSATDADLDTLIESFTWLAPDGSTFSDPGSVSSTQLLSQAGQWTCIFEVSDGMDVVTSTQFIQVVDDCSNALTDWSSVSSELAGLPDMLPSIPAEFLQNQLAGDGPELQFHQIIPGERGTEVRDDSSCEVPPFWDADRVAMGPYLGAASTPYCRVNMGSSGTGLYVRTKQSGSYHELMTGEPGWVRYRFPLPDGHQPKTLSYEASWARLFGSSPTECHSSEQDASGDCTLSGLDPAESWDDDVPPGLFMLWAEPGSCEGWVVSGPHAPAEEFTWSAPERFLVDVPAEMQDVEELVVAFLVYHQYPGGCENTYCDSAYGEQSTIAFHDVELLSEAPFEPSQEPPLLHPRMLGDNLTWMQDQQAFENLGCYDSSWPTNSAWGGLSNIPNLWHNMTKGGNPCESTLPANLSDVPFAQSYLDGTAASSLDITRAMQALHLIRRERACQETALGICVFSPQEVDDLAAAVIDVELTRLPSVSFNSFSFPFDLRTREPMRVYTMVADVLWDELTAAEHQALEEAFDPQIDGYLNHFEEQHWAVFNGNNWTPVLAEGALYWAITYYHEDPRAPEVAKLALYSMGLHRDAYLADGVYYEGLLMYSQVSFDPVMQVARIAKSSFGYDLAAMHWDRMGDFADWAMAFMATDGYTVDFSDSWRKKGWGTFMPLLAHMIDPQTGRPELSPDPCFAASFFSNKYYFHGFTDPWNAHPALAQDWPGILDACVGGPSQLSDVETRVWSEGGWGSLRVGVPGQTSLGASADPVSRFSQTDQTMVAISAIPNTAPHTELDFGGFVWTAYGNRLLWDWGYGSISNFQYRIDPDYDTFDNSPVAHNTLVIPEAIDGSDLSTNTSQIDGEVGSMELYELDGYSVVTLDGSAVYGRDDPSLGWLESFERSFIALPEGHIVLIDAFEVRTDRGLVAPEENWISASWDASLTSSCGVQGEGTLRITNSDRVTLLPSCSDLESSAPAESVGELVGTGYNSGSFVDRGEASLLNRLNVLDTMGRFAWEPDAVQDGDLRLFALISAPSEATLPLAEWSWDTSTPDPTVTLSLDGAPRLELRFTALNQTYLLTELADLP